MTFLDANGEEAEITGTPTISIYHRKGDSTVTDVNAQSMIQLSGSKYFYEYHIPANADKTVYYVVYNATYSDGTKAVGDETFQVVPRKFFSKKGGGFTSKTIYKGVWTRKEKESLLEKLNKLLAKLEDMNVIEKKKLSEEIERLKLIKKEILESIKTSDYSESLQKILTILYELKRQKEGKGIISKLQSLANKVNKIEERTIILDRKKEIDEIKSDLEEMAKFIVKTIPSDKLEEMVKECRV